MINFSQKLAGITCLFVCFFLASCESNGTNIDEQIEQLKNKVHMLEAEAKLLRSKNSELSGIFALENRKRDLEREAEQLEANYRLIKSRNSEHEQHFSQ